MRQADRPAAQPGHKAPFGIRETDRLPGHSTSAAPDAGYVEWLCA